MREQVTAKVREGLLPVLGASESSSEIGTRSRSDEAHDLYLRSVAIPHDPGPNKDAIPMLERVVGMNQNHAPAWVALGARYYTDATYADGGEAVLQRSNARLSAHLRLIPT
jgi:hypothetical protein